MVYEYFSNENLFKRHKYASPKDTEKTVCPKNVWMQHCSWTDWEGGSKIF